MAHPKTLLDQIEALLLLDYPLDGGYRYVRERWLAGTRMQPDIQVLLSNRVVCAVEVGYTRPEKLTAYRLTIPDVRWYDKQGQLHADVKVETRVVRATVSLEPAPTQDFSLYVVNDCVGCFDERCLEAEAREYMADGWDDGDEVELEDAEALEPLLPFEDEFAPDKAALETADAYAHEYVETVIVTDRHTAWLFSTCDKCGRRWPTEDADAEWLVDEVGDLCPREFGRKYGARVGLVSWPEACAFVAEYGHEMVYEDGIDLTEGEAKSIKQLTATLRAEAIAR